MARKTYTRTGSDGGKYYVTIDDGEVSEIVQTITQVNSKKTHVRVISGNMKEYWVKLSDKVRLTIPVKVRDEAVIKTFPKQWLVTDIIPYEEPEKSEIEILLVKSIHNELTPEEEERLAYLKKTDKDYLEQMEAFESLVEDY